MRAPALFLGIVAPIMASASEPSFYSFRSRAFVPLAEVQVRKDLVATWRSNDGRHPVLRLDGKFSAGKMGGCWDVDGRKLLLRSACVNYGVQKNSVILTHAEPTDECSFYLSARLVLKNCTEAGEYLRKEPPPARR
jgi:hypothetical protein